MDRPRHDDESTPPPVLLVGEYGAMNGGENSLLAILPHLQAIDWTFTALVPANSEFSSKLYSLGIHTLNFDPGSGPTRKTQAEIRTRIHEVIQDVGPSLVHANSLSTSRLCGPVTSASNTPSLGHLRDIVGLSVQAIADLNQLDQLIAVSAVTRDFHVEQGLDEQKIVVVHNGVDLHRFHSPEDERDALTVRDDLNLPTDSQLLLCIGQIGIRKGVDDVLTAFASLQHEFPRLHLCVVGSRHSQKQEAVAYEQQLHAQAAPLQDRVHWLGRRSDVPQLMRAATLLVHAARQEPLGRVLLEACASALPLVTTNVGGTPEILPPPLAAQLICEKHQPEQLAVLIRPLLGSPQLRQQVGAQLRDVAERKFSVERCAAEVGRIYTATAARGGK
jgi:glycosyltransferase involved in cell wall biosynthesis